MKNIYVHGATNMLDTALTESACPADPAWTGYARQTRIPIPRDIDAHSMNSTMMTTTDDDHADRPTIYTFGAEPNDDIRCGDKFDCIQSTDAHHPCKKT